MLLRPFAHLARQRAAAAARRAFGSAVTIHDVKALRVATGAGVGECKKALEETGNDQDAAVAWLRKSGAAKAAKKGGRVSAHGLVAALPVVLGDGVRGCALVEINSETDFAARSDTFVALVADVVRAVGATVQDGAQGAAGAAFLDLEAALRAPVAARGGVAAGDALAEASGGVIGERLELRRAAVVAGPGALGAYVYNAAGPADPADGLQLGLAAAVVGLRGGAASAGADEVARKVAMHAVAAGPRYASLAAAPADAVAAERAVLLERPELAGKPDEIVERILSGGLTKWAQDHCLLEQKHMIDLASKKTVGQVIARDAEGASLYAFAMLKVGEEVAVAAGGREE